MNTLVVYRLKVQSSYAQDLECEADAQRFDTVQWWLAPDHAWRIKTFAIDQDIHCYRVGAPIAEGFARENTEKHYGDVVAASFSIKVADLLDKARIASAMQAFGGARALEIDRNGGKFAFWNPLQVEFTSKSQPDRDA